MTIPTQLSLHGFIATAPELTFVGNGEARFHARAGIEQWRREPNGELTKLDPVFCHLVLFGRRAERAYDRFRKGDQFVASGYINEYERQRDGHRVRCEEFVAPEWATTASGPVTPWTASTRTVRRRRAPRCRSRSSGSEWGPP